MYVCMYVCVCGLFICIYLFPFLYVCVYMCMYIYIYILEASEQLEGLGRGEGGLAACTTKPDKFTAPLPNVGALS